MGKPLLVVLNLTDIVALYTVIIKLYRTVLNRAWKLIPEIGGTGMKKTMIRAIPAFLIILMVMGSLPGLFTKYEGKAYAAESFAGGAGTANDPYQIATAEQLNEVRNHSTAGKYFVLTADIDLSSMGNWVPIPNFQGVFDGNGYVISKLYIYSTQYNVGLFERTTGATLKNIWLEDISVHRDSVGNVGGLAGWIDGGIIENSYARGTVSGADFDGGLVGYNKGTIRNSYAAVNTSGGGYVGGLAAYNHGVIQNSFATGAVSGYTFTGGLAGYNYGTVQNSFYDINTTRQSDSGKGIGKSNEDMKLASTFADWNHVIWRIQDGQYPEIRNIQLTPGTDAGTTKLTQVENGMEFSVEASSFNSITSAVYDNIPVNVGDRITIQFASQPELGSVTKTVRYIDIQPAEAPAALLEQGSTSGTTKLVGVSDLMEYSVNAGEYQDISDTFVDNIEVDEGDQIYVRMKKTLLQPASKVRILNVTSADIKPAATISIAEITGVTVPARGQIPVSTLPGTSEYAATIEWSPANSVFRANTVYIATITVTPNIGYTLTGVPADFFTVAGATSVTNAVNSGVVTAVFPATGSDPVSDNGGSNAPSVTPADNPPPSETPADPEPATEEDTIYNKYIIDEDELVERLKIKAAEAKEANAESEFADTREHWAVKTIEIFDRLKLITGYPDGLFRPNNAITRAEFARILNRVFHIHNRDGSNISMELKDIEGSWAKEDIEKLAAAGVIRGYPDGTFRPNQTITREEMVVMISFIVNLDVLEKDTIKGHFNDLDGAYAAEKIIAEAQAGIVSGKGAGRFEPKSRATRAEALRIILNALQLHPELKKSLDSLL